jgi:hypothetical protein
MISTKKEPARQGTAHETDDGSFYFVVVVPSRKSIDFWPEHIDCSPVLIDPERARRMEARREVLQDQSRELVGNDGN